MLHHYILVNNQLYIWWLSHKVLSLSDIVAIRVHLSTLFDVHIATKSPKNAVLRTWLHHHGTLSFCFEQAVTVEAAYLVPVGTELIWSWTFTSTGNSLSPTTTARVEYYKVTTEAWSVCLDPLLLYGPKFQFLAMPFSHVSLPEALFISVCLSQWI